MAMKLKCRRKGNDSAGTRPTNPSDAESSETALRVYEVAVDWVDDPGSTADVVQTTPRSAAASATRAATSSGTSMVNLAMTRQL
jgi:hypothetical protein